MAKNNNLHNAKRAKNDEFYTTRATVELELNHYKEHFRGKVVYCNCDDPIESEFTRYFARKFEDWGLKKLISTGYKESGHGVMYVYEGDKNGNLVPDRSEWKITELQGNGDFRSEECIEFLKEADVVVTNPPFSLFREVVAQLVEYNKKFLLLGNNNAITYKEIFPLIMSNKMWLGYSNNKTMEFVLSDSYEKWDRIENGKKIGKVPAISWFTNLEHDHRNRPLDLTQRYDPKYYPKFDNYSAINIDKVMDIPVDYDGVMAVPITFLDKYCPNQFRIIGCTESEGKGFSNGLWNGGVTQPMVDNKRIYKRLFIQKV